MKLTVRKTYRSLDEYYENCTEEYKEQYKKELHQAVVENCKTEKRIGDTFKDAFTNAVVYAVPDSVFSGAEYVVDRQGEYKTDTERQHQIEKHVLERECEYAVEALVNLIYHRRDHKHTNEKGEKFCFGSENLENFVKALAEFGGIVFDIMDKNYDDESTVAGMTLINALAKKLPEYVEHEEVEVVYED